MSGLPRELPPQPSLKQLRKQAKDLLYLHRTRDPAATWPTRSSPLRPGWLDADR